MNVSLGIKTPSLWLPQHKYKILRIKGTFLLRRFTINNHSENGRFDFIDLIEKFTKVPQNL